ncbi:superoxide dismutase family protein [Paenibacillus mesophilus]|uniref:superoxide dismutase family protein n=1 Tax=Paenibacillus mesophilus TaxID=2582849 RepID=UPI00110DE571|nr:superoxide dismutase family protein [Paenibacillus mesophilus]TMV52716.1 superoxide dismutase family protein [Paenibacillus mesophilus]
MKGKQYGLLTLGLLLLAATGCGSKPVSGRAAAESPEPAVRTTIVNTEGKTIGSATFTQEPGGVRVRMEVSGITPGVHGFHFHDTGKCDTPDFTTAGPHLNPTSKKHGLLSMEGPHAGDMPNLTAGADGVAKADWLAGGVTLAKGKPNSLHKEGGTAIVIHEKADDGMTDPAGNSGARIACGVIR